jgi:hypothetical protein
VTILNRKRVAAGASGNVDMPHGYHVKAQFWRMVTQKAEGDVASSR